MKLSVGITNVVPSWDVLLNQIGVSHKIIEAGEILNQKYPVVIVDDKINKDTKNIFDKYLSGGGFLLMELEAAKKLFNVQGKKKKIKYIFSKEDTVFNFSVYCEIGTTLNIPFGANHLNDSTGEKTILIKTVGNGLIVVLPQGFSSLIFSHKVRRKRFYTQYGNDFPTERVARIDKGSIYNIIYRLIEFLFHKKNLPFVRLWQFPFGYETIFGFRIDTDFASDEDINNLYNLMMNNQIKGTWFVETSSRENDCKIFKNFSEQEIALHCYRHKIYSKTSDNINDIKKGLQILENSGLSVTGYASPFGEWNVSLAEALQKFKFNYSSEFSYINDAFPINPIISNSFKNILQIPIHPVSTGRLHWAQHNEKDMIDYFYDIIEKKVKSYEPVFLYTHPSQKRLTVYENIFKRINELNIPSYAFNDFALWWAKRKSFEWEPELSENRTNIFSKIKDESIYFHSSYCNGKNYLSKMDRNLKNEKEIQPVNFNLLSDFKPDLMYRKTIGMRKQDIIFNFRKLLK